MIGKDLWEDMNIDALHLESEINHLAVNLVDHYGAKLTEVDVLSLKTLECTEEDPIKRALARACLSYYSTMGYTPLKHQLNETPNKKSWWKLW